MMKRFVKQTALAASLALATSGCFRGGARLFTAMAIMTTAIVISQPPPPPRDVYVPGPRPGYFWQPGYWTVQDDDWVWVEGRWIAKYPGYRWDPAHWEEDPGGHWRLVPGRWIAGEPPPPR